MKNVVQILLFFSSLALFGKHSFVYQAYNSGDLDAAQNHCLKMLESDPYHDQVNYNLGNILYKKGLFKEAADSFSRVSGTMEEKAFFNKGNAHYQMKDYAGAIEAYEHALQLDPNDEKIKHNLELARKKLQEQQQQQDQEQDQQNNQQQNQDQKKDGSDKKNDQQKDSQGENNQQDKNESEQNKNGEQEKKGQDQSNPNGQNDQRNGENDLDNRSQNKNDLEKNHEKHDQNDSGQNDEQQKSGKEKNNNVQQNPQEIQPQQNKKEQQQKTEHQDSPSQKNVVTQALQNSEKSPLMDDVHKDERLDETAQILMKRLEEDEKTLQKVLTRMAVKKQGGEVNGKKNW